MATVDGETPPGHSREEAVSLDARDPLRHLRQEFHIPSKAQLRAKSLPDAGKRCEFLCGVCMELSSLSSS
jgi:kynureninase